MTTEFLPPHRGRDTLKSQAETRRFVPTLTEVVHLPSVAAGIPLPISPTPDVAEPDAIFHTIEVDEQAVARVCAAVMQGLDEHVRAVVSHALQVQQQLLVQSFADQLAPLVETRVRQALLGMTVQVARQNGEGCIQATD